MHGDHRAAFPSVANGEPTTERFQTEGQSFESTAGSKASTTAAVVGHGQFSVGSPLPKSDFDSRRTSVTDGVGQALGSGEIEGTCNMGMRTDIGELGVHRHRLLIRQRFERDS